MHVRGCEEVSENEQFGIVLIAQCPVHEHHRDVIDDWIHTLTVYAAQSVSFLGHLDRLLASGTNKNVQQFLSNGHK